MSFRLAQRQVVVAAAALLAAIAGLAIAERDSARHRPVSRLPPPAEADQSRWDTALAGVRSRPLAGRRSACGTVLNPAVLGVGHPVLPCGARLYLAFGENTVLTSVVDRGPYAPGREFEVTPSLAKLLGLTGVRRVRWTFARAP